VSAHAAKRTDRASSLCQSPNRRLFLRIRPISFGFQGTRCFTFAPASTRGTRVTSPHFRTAGRTEDARSRRPQVCATSKRRYPTTEFHSNILHARTADMTTQKKKTPHPPPFAQFSAGSPWYARAQTLEAWAVYFYPKFQNCPGSMTAPHQAYDSHPRVHSLGFGAARAGSEARARQAGRCRRLAPAARLL